MAFHLCWYSTFLKHPWTLTTTFCERFMVVTYILRTFHSMNLNFPPFFKRNVAGQIILYMKATVKKGSRGKKFVSLTWHNKFWYTYSTTYCVITNSYFFLIGTVGKLFFIINIIDFPYAIFSSCEKLQWLCELYFTLITSL